MIRSRSRRQYVVLSFSGEKLQEMSRTRERVREGKKEREIKSQEKTKDNEVRDKESQGDRQLGQLWTGDSLKTGAQN